ncbi:hypothetical protein JZ751_022508 [Albula glossodonta]|uniref:Uncharacterized protein n=1 Tax=Albula glossodonta TaxID=121402 RepID=A0A8T2NKP7_9TELE|nr:hypothetical protein JZ751_022508 [Albula glossodonta]
MRGDSQPPSGRYVLAPIQAGGGNTAVTVEMHERGTKQVDNVPVLAQNTGTRRFWEEGVQRRCRSEWHCLPS